MNDSTTPKIFAGVTGVLLFIVFKIRPTTRTRSPFKQSAIGSPVFRLTRCVTLWREKRAYLSASVILSRDNPK